MPVNVREGVDPRLLEFADQHGLLITAGRNGKHNVGSKHYIGHAIDVRSRGMSDGQVLGLKGEARAAGFLLRDERTRPPHQAVWGGPHLHIEII